MMENYKISLSLISRPVPGFGHTEVSKSKIWSQLMDPTSQAKWTRHHRQNGPDITGNNYENMYKDFSHICVKK